MEKPTQSESEKRIYFIMNNTSGAWLKVSDEYSRLTDAMRALERLISRYPFARLGGMTLR
ncbi:MAG: hypothetical protein H0V62_13980 [Gammaproteobacteria bacterium]|nr:hypothetical protein [Gammaproteobacteria bacterium]MBA3731916.1 hypothetical protein [Gammaproteobacteria bacterium]